MTFLGDMPQQADNAGFLRHTAIRGCRSCLCERDEFGDLDYDIIANGRYHSHTRARNLCAQADETRVRSLLAGDVSAHTGLNAISTNEQVCLALHTVRKGECDAQISLRNTRTRPKFFLVLLCPEENCLTVQPLYISDGIMEMSLKSVSTQPLPTEGCYFNEGNTRRFKTTPHITANSDKVAALRSQYSSILRICHLSCHP